MIRYGNKDDITAIKELWYTTFDDDKAFSDYFFEYIFDIKYTLLYIENNSLVSMLQALPYKIATNSFNKITDSSAEFNNANSIDVTYIYGAATNKAHRGKGLMKALINKSFELDSNNGRFASILIPAEPSLFNYYKTLGYDASFYINKDTYTPTNSIFSSDVILATTDSISILESIYTGSIIRDKTYWLKQIQMTKTLGSKIYILSNRAYAFVADSCNIQELMYKDAEAKNILLSHISADLNTSKINIIEKGNTTPFGMIKYHKNIDKGQNMYMNLMYN